MATSIDEPLGTVRTERVYIPVAEGEGAQRVRTPLDGHYSEDIILQFGPRMRWGGLIAGIVAAGAVILLSTMLGVTLGLSTLDNILFSTNNEDAQKFATMLGMWTGLTALLAYFVAGMVSTKVTDRPDGGALLHGTLVWMLLSMTLSWLVTNGIVLGFGRLPGRLLPSTVQDASPVNPQTLTEAELAQRLGLADPSQLMAPASDEQIISALVTTAHMSREEAEAALDDLRARVAVVEADPDAVQAEIRAFLAQMLARIQQQPRGVEGTSQFQPGKGSWLTFGSMVVTLLMAIIGARVGVPRRHFWQRVGLRH